MQELNAFLNSIDGYLGSHVWFVYALLGTGLFFTIYLKFPQVRYFRHAIRITKGDFDKATDQGDTSHFQALATALSGTVGTGNIAGVALALHIGGPAALFWMLVTAMFGMTTKFVEVTLSHKYREVAEDGTMAGGPMYYMKNKMNMKWLGIIFALATVISSFGTGNMPQINSIANSVYSTFGIDQMVTGGVLAVILGFVIIGGIKRIAQVTEKLVPGMAAIYIIGALAVIFYNAENVLPSFISIFSEVFSGSAAVGGFLGASVSFAFMKGVGRGLFSNEAGQGSAPIAHASAKGHEPVSEGMVAILEPFIDTIIICTITGLVLLSSGAWNKKFQNDFQNSDLIVFSGTYLESNATDKEKIAKHIGGQESLTGYSGPITITSGKLDSGYTVINAESFAEDVFVRKDGSAYSGSIVFKDGRLQSDVTLSGKSLLHSAPLTIEAFKFSFFGDFGQYIVTIGLLLFAFSTAISWSYYGDRAMTFIWGSGSVKYYRIVYVIGFFWASYADTTVIWTLAAVAIALMTIPNLFGLVMLHKDMKKTVTEYWDGFKKEYPNEKSLH